MPLATIPLTDADMQRADRRVRLDESAMAVILVDTAFESTMNHLPVANIFGDHESSVIGCRGQGNHGGAEQQE